MNIRVHGFEHGSNIPAVYTCDGEDFNPEITISEIPEGTKDLVLIVDDPDASGGEVFTHWTVWNIPFDNGEVTIPTAAKPNFATQGINSAGTFGYMGPCPGNGKPHRYFFTAYAISEPVVLSQGATIGELRDAISSSIIANAQYGGMYARSAQS